LRHDRDTADGSEEMRRVREQVKGTGDKRRDEVVERVLSLTRKGLRQRLAEKDQGILSIDEIEEIALEVRDEMGRAIAGELANEEASRKAVESQTSKMGCSCGRKAWYHGDGERFVLTMVGLLTLSRRLYYCRVCDHCVIPADQALGLPKHLHTPQVERTVGEVCVEVPSYERAMGLMERLSGVGVSPKEAQRITDAIGEWAQQKNREDVQRVLPRSKRSPHIRHRNPQALAEQVHDPAMMGYVLADGVMTPMRGGAYKEAKLGEVLLVRKSEKDQSQWTKEQTEREPLAIVKKRYVHHLGEPNALGEQLYAEAARIGICELSSLAALGDGATWIWRQMKTHFPKAVQILDWQHATEHMYDAARFCIQAALVAQKRNKAIDEEELSRIVEEWTEPVKELMWNGKVEAVIRAVEALPVKNADAANIITETVNYYTNNQERMRYDRFRAKGFRIGSGTIESACKQIVGTRMKGPGMRWKEKGARAVGCLRAIRLAGNNYWDDFLSKWPGRGLELSPAA